MMYVESLLTLSVSLWFLTSCAFLVLYFLLGDKMFLRFALAFTLIFIGRLVFNLSPPEVPLYIKQNVAILLRACASYLLIIASLNGHRENRYTDRILGSFLVVAVLTQWWSTEVKVPLPLSMGPIPFAISLGWFFAAWKFLFDAPEEYRCCPSYRFIGVVFFLRGVFAVLGSWALVPTEWLLWVGVGDIIALVGLLLGGIVLGFQRHRVLMECQRTPGRV